MKPTILPTNPQNSHENDIIYNLAKYMARDLPGHKTI
jgi:hypothetical protein